MSGSAPVVPKADKAGGDDDDLDLFGSDDEVISLEMFCFLFAQYAHFQDVYHQLFVIGLKINVWSKPRVGLFKEKKNTKVT